MAAPDPGAGGPPEFTPAQVEFLEGQFARRTAEQEERITAALAGQIATQFAQLREEAAKAQADLRDGPRRRGCTRPSRPSTPW